MINNAQRTSHDGNVRNYHIPNHTTKHFDEDQAHRKLEILILEKNPRNELMSTQSREANLTNQHVIPHIKPKEVDGVTMRNGHQERLYDRHSGTGRGKEIKKGGAGGLHTWGMNPKEIAREFEKHGDIKDFGDDYQDGKLTVNCR